MAAGLIIALVEGSYARVVLDNGRSLKDYLGSHGVRAVSSAHRSALVAIHL